MPLRRHAWRALMLVVLLSGCTLGPSSRPEVAVYGGRVAPPVSTQTTTGGFGPGGPGQSARLDQDWAECPDLEATGRAAAFLLDCARMAVPVDYAHPSDGRLSLYLGRARAPDLAEDAPTLVVLMVTGPFEAQLAGVRQLPDLAASLPSVISEHFQLVTFDVRGSGRSVNADCFPERDIDVLFGLPADAGTPDGTAVLTELTRLLTFGCQDTLGSGLVHFSTTAVADDLDSLRSALDLDTLSVLGAGYGATVGAVYAHRYPHRVGRIALDAPTNAAIAPSERAALAAQAYHAALEAFGTDCVARPGCPFDDGADVLDAALAAADDSLRGAPLWVGAGSVLWATQLGLADRELWPELADVLATASEGDGAALVSLLRDLLVRDERTSFSARLVLACNDTDERLTDAQLATASTEAATNSPVFGPFLVAQSALCRQWPAPESALGSVRAHGAAPIMVIGGVGDPVAPHQGVQALVQQLASAILVSYQGTDHGGYPRSSCVAEHVHAFLVDGQVPPANALCAG